MTDKKEQTKAGADELSKQELEKVQGGLLAHELTHLKRKKSSTSNTREVEDDVIVDGNIITAENYDSA